MAAFRSDLSILKRHAERRSFPATRARHWTNLDDFSILKHQYTDEQGPFCVARGRARSPLNSRRECAARARTAGRSQNRRVRYRGPAESIASRLPAIANPTLADCRGTAQRTRLPSTLSSGIFSEKLFPNSIVITRYEILATFLSLASFPRFGRNGSRDSVDPSSKAPVPTSHPVPFRSRDQKSQSSRRARRTTPY